MNFDNRDEINKRIFVFRTDEDKWNPVDVSGHLSDKVGYFVEYDKQTHMVSIHASSYTIPETGLKEAEMDQIAKRMAVSIDASAVFQSKDMNYQEGNKQINSIQYHFRIENQGKLEEEREIKIIVEKSGLVSEVVLWDSSL